MAQPPRPFQSRAKRRRPGRPANSDSKHLNREAVIEVGYELARDIPLQDLSIVLVSKEMGVTPALIHYYIKGRDGLTSGIMNLFYRDLLAKLPARTGRWDADLFNVAEAIYLHYIERAGVVAYAVAHNRFRTFQMVEPDERDHGVDLLDRYSQVVMEAGLSSERTAIYGHLLMEFIISAAHNSVRHRSPEQYEKFLRERTGSLSSDDYPGIAFTREGLFGFDALAAFREGARMMLSSMQAEQMRAAVAARPTPSLPEARQAVSR